MARTRSQAAAAGPPASTSPPVKTSYLVLYNLASAVAWSVVLIRTIQVAANRGPAYVHADVGEWTKWTQSMAALEILHSLLGIVRSPVFTTAVQVASRLVLVWAVVHPFPYLAVSPFYTSMLLAWSVTEVIRYSFFALTLSGYQPRPLLWLRYNTFFILYPVGISSECVMIYLALGPSAKLHPLAPYALYALLAIYVPASYMLFTHMMKQRRRIMAGNKTKSVKATQ